MTPPVPGGGARRLPGPGARSDPQGAPPAPERLGRGRLLAPGGRGRGWAPRGATTAHLDVDGTTLDTGPTASTAVASAFRRARAAGASLHFATGRLPRGMRALHQQLDHDAPDVVHNGAAVVHGERLLAAWPLPGAAADRLADWCLQQGHYAELHLPRLMYVTDDRAEARIGWQEVSGPPDGMAADITGTGATVLKATVNVYDADRLTDVVAFVEGLGLTAEVSSAPIMPGVPVVNATAAGVTKGSALAWLDARSARDPTRALAVGDGWNDVSMFRVAGTAVAMGQAPAGVRAEADLVAPTVGDDGLAVVLDLLADHGL